MIAVIRNAAVALAALVPTAGPLVGAGSPARKASAPVSVSRTMGSERLKVISPPLLFPAPLLRFSSKSLLLLILSAPFLPRSLGLQLSEYCIV